MSTIALSSLFTADAIASHFDAQASEQAAKGKTYQPLLTMLDGAYGLSIPAQTVAAIKYLNMNLFAQTEAPKLAKGVGARSATVVVTLALHQYASAMFAGMHADTIKAQGPDFGVHALPEWADAVKLAEKKQKAKDARQAKRDADAAALAAKLEAEAAEAENGIAAQVNAAPVDVPAESRAAWAKFAAFLDFGALTVAERDAYIEALQGCTTRAEEVSKAEKKAEKRVRKSRSADRKQAEAVAQRANVAAVAADLKERAAKAVAEAGAEAGADSAGAAFVGPVMTQTELLTA